MPVVVAGLHRLRQDTLKELTAESKPQDDLLPVLCAPAAAVHHPEEVRLDPAHAREREAAAEIAVLNREASDGRPVGLVEDDRVVIVVGEDMTTFRRPVLCLF